MKKWIGGIVIPIFAVLIFWFFGDNKIKNERARESLKNEKEDSFIMLKLESDVFKNGDSIPVVYTCDGKNINPPLKISGAPSGTRSLALVVDDPDATRGETWDHWVMWNISPEIEVIKEGNVPSGAVQGSTSWGGDHRQYGGPCPPPGKAHRYFFKLYALRTILDLKAGATKTELEAAIEGQVLEKAEIFGLYQRR